MELVSQGGVARCVCCGRIVVLRAREGQGKVKKQPIILYKYLEYHLVVLPLVLFYC